MKNQIRVGPKNLRDHTACPSVYCVTMLYMCTQALACFYHHCFLTHHMDHHRTSLPFPTPLATPLATSPPIQPLLLSLDQRQMSPIASANNSNELCVLWWYLGSTVETFVDKDAVELEPLNISGRAMPASSSGPSLAIMVFID